MIGYDLSEVLDREPAKWFVRVSKGEKRSCGKCSALRMPPLAPRIVEKGLASDRVIIETVVAKYCDHLPLYRQEAMPEREAGVEISRATLDGWVMRVGELLQPVAGAMRDGLLRGTSIQADETIVPGADARWPEAQDHPAYLSQRKHSEAAHLTPARWKASQPSRWSADCILDPPGHRQHKIR